VTQASRLITHAFCPTSCRSKAARLIFSAASTLVQELPFAAPMKAALFTIGLAVGSLFGWFGVHVCK
jgi:hypothetical protein